MMHGQKNIKSFTYNKIIGAVKYKPVFFRLDDSPAPDAGESPKSKNTVFRPWPKFEIKKYEHNYTP